MPHFFDTAPLSQCFLWLLRFSFFVSGHFACLCGSLFLVFVLILQVVKDLEDCQTSE